jgi:hypothetical protein
MMEINGEGQEVEEGIVEEKRVKRRKLNKEQDEF